MKYEIKWIFIQYKWISEINESPINNYRYLMHNFFFDPVRVYFNLQQEGDFIDYTIDLLSTLTVGEHPLMPVLKINTCYPESFLLSVDTVPTL